MSASEALLDAAWAGDSAAISRILGEGVSVNGTDEAGCTALHFAASMGHAAVAQRLLDAGAAVEARHEKQLTPLMTAAGCGHAAALETLLNARASVEAQEEQDGYTALHLAAGMGHAVVAQRLLDAGAAVDARKKKQLTPLMTAADCGHAAGLETLLNARASVEAQEEQDGYTALHIAAELGRAVVAQLLLDAGAAVDARRKSQLTPLMTAAGCGHAAALEEQAGYTALHLAAHEGHGALAQRLLDAGAAVDARSKAGEVPLEVAKTDEIREMLQAAAEERALAAADAAAAAAAAATAAGHTLEFAAAAAAAAAPAATASATPAAAPAGAGYTPEFAAAAAAAAAPAATASATPAAAPAGAGIRRPSEQQIRQLFSATAGSRFQITRIEPVYNDVLEPMFLGTFRLFDRRRIAGGVFEPAERAGVDAVDKQRKVTLIEHLKSSFTTEQWMTQLDGWHRRSNVALVWHGASAEAISSIAETGFASLARFDSPDPGFFGNGRYTTLEAALACEYASSYPYPGKTPNAAGEFVVLLAAVVIGKAYAVTRGAADFPWGTQCVYEGRPLEPGFDTHFIAIEGDLETCCVDPQTAVYHEVLSAQDSQLLPLAKVYFTKP